MLGGVADDRDHDHADEHLGESQDPRRLDDGADEQLAHPRDERRGDEQREDRAPDVHGAVLVLGSGALVEVTVRAQREEQRQQIGREQHDRDLQRQAVLELHLVRLGDHATADGSLGDEVIGGRHEQRERGQREQR